MTDLIDALFLPFYANMDRWHNDSDGDLQYPSMARNRALLSALSDDMFMKDEVDLVVDGKLYDFPRFLSWVRYDTTTEYRRYDPFNQTLLAGTYYLSLLHRHGYDVRVANVVDRETLARLAERYEPRFVLLSTTLLFDAAESDLIPIAVRQIRHHWPDTVIVLGGLMLVSYRNNLSKEEFLNALRYYSADAYVVSAFGETSLLEILQRGSKEDILKDPDIVSTYVVHDGTVYEPSQPHATAIDMNENRIRWSELPQTEHLYHIVSMRTARSCAFNCAFCEYPINQGPLTLMPIEEVDRELAEIAALGTVKSLIFTDDTFNVPLKRFKELCKVLAKYDFEWFSFFRPQYADKETARLMKEANCRAVFAGLEAADDQMLVNMNKRATVDAYRRGLEQLKENDIQTHANFIVGFPGETEASARKITPLLNELETEFYTVCTWVYLPSTPISARTSDFGIEGMGVEWRHNTMNSEEAQVLAREIVDEPKVSVHNAVRGEAWTEFLLYGNGFTVDEAKLAVKTFNGGLGRDNAAEDIRSSADYKALRSVLGQREMPRPAD